jgi:hypothetical protein
MTMLSQCMSAVCVLGIVTIGILIMTRIISLEQVVKATGRVFLLLVTALLALCMVQGFLMTAAMAALVLVKRLMVWLVIIALVIISAMLVARIAISKFEKWLPGRGDHRGEP